MLNLSWRIALALILFTLGARAQLVVPVETPTGKPHAMKLYDESHALLIGISDYTAGWTDLESVPGELAEVGGALEAQGFNVESHLDLDHQTMKRVFEQFIARHGYATENRLLFFFSGHGYTRAQGEKGYLVPADAPDPRDDDTGFLRSALSMTQILAWARQIEAKHALFMFDSCFSGTVFKARNLPNYPQHITTATGLPTRQFITAGSAGDEVPAQSVFTPAFIDALRYGWADLDKDKYVTGTELGLYLRKTVPQYTRQVPQFGSIQDYKLSRGDYVFVVGLPDPVGEVSEGEAASDTEETDDMVEASDFAEAREVEARDAKDEAAPTEAVRETPPPVSQAVVPSNTAEGLPTLTLRSNVWQDRVLVDGEPRGTTRLDLALPPGEHHIRIEKDGYLPFEQTIDLQQSRVLRGILRPNLALDRDHDGVPDAVDRCPNSTDARHVDERGCRTLVPKKLQGIKKWLDEITLE